MQPTLIYSIKIKYKNYTVLHMKYSFTKMKYKNGQRPKYYKDLLKAQYIKKVYRYSIVASF